MKKVIVIYGSTTGSTQKAAELIGQALSSADTIVDVLNVTETKPETVAGYDFVVLGSSTWGQGEIQDDFIDFYGNMTSDSFGGKKVAVFGCGDSDMFPDYFCDAVDLIAQKAKECGAEIIGELFKVDGEVDAYQQQLEQWAAGLI